MPGTDLLPLPTGRFALLVLLGCLIFPLAAPGSAWLWWSGYNLLILILAAADWRTAPTARRLLIAPVYSAKWVRGEEQAVELRVTGPEAQDLDLIQDVPGELGGPALPVRVSPEGGISYRVAARERGLWHLGDIHGRWRTRFGLLVKRGLWQRQDPVKVYAPLYIDRGPALLSPRQRVQEQGSALVRSSGVHTEFESLRDYREGDEVRAVNWRASARRGRLVVNQYQAERTQQIMIALDAGRLMLPEYRGIPRFEYCLSAALQLGRLAAEREDRVGMMIFGGNRQVLLPPGRGQAQVARMAEAACTVNPQMMEPDYAGALAELSGSLKRRSLLLFFTDFVSPGASRDLVEHLLRLVPRHLVVVLAISDPALTQLAHGEVGTVAGAYAQAGADWVLEERAAARTALTQKGIAVLDVPPLKLSSTAINKYLQIKKQGLL